jgi:signal transduction histidine kinase/methyl-accepting chemotaxis protein
MDMPTTLRKRIWMAFVGSILLLAVCALALLLINQVQAFQNRKTIETMTTEYSIISLSTKLIESYSDVARNPEDPQYLAQYQSIRTQLGEVLALLKEHINSTESKILLLGVESTVLQVLHESDTGIEEIKQNNFLDFSTHFAEANKDNDFVRDNVRALLQKELEYLSTTQQQSQRLYTITIIGSLALFVVFVVVMIVYAQTFSRQLVAPLEKLSLFAKEIAQGNLQAQAQHNLPITQDETGSLTQSVYTMVDKLLAMYASEKSVKERIEQTVIERTRQLSDEQAKLIASINAIRRGFVLIDRNGVVSLSNTEVSHLLSSEQQAWTLESLATTLTGAFRLKEHLTLCFEKLATITQKEVSFGNKYLNFYLAPVLTKDKQLIGAVLTIKDVTEARVIARSKDEFFSIASHELRTPLTAIRGNTAMMLEYYADTFKDPELKQMMDDTHDASVRLIGIVNDFLDMSRLEMGKIEFKLAPTDLLPLISAVLKEYQVTGSRQKIALELVPSPEPIPPVMVDSDRLRQVLVNLVGNAIKFTKVGGVKVELHMHDAKVAIWVSDTGAGIPLANQGLLFHKFQQAGSSLATRDTSKGTGLGLYISRLLVEGMGGTLELIKSEEGKGSVFGITVNVVDLKGSVKV